jgi:hypothetical protein
MSMDDYEAPAMRFALDNEFEGGEFGADGEFYAYGQKVHLTIQLVLTM